jgi:hypothetical protein
MCNLHSNQRVPSSPSPTPKPIRLREWVEAVLIIVSYLGGLIWLVIWWAENS